MFRTPHRACFVTSLIAVLGPLLLLSQSRAETPEPFPRDQAPVKKELFLTGGVSEFLPCLGIRFRDKGQYEAVVRFGLLPTSQSAELSLNFYADNPEPTKRGTWYFGPGLFYYHSDDEAGLFRLAYLDAMAGREKRLSNHWRFNWEAGLGVLVYESVRTIGAPILFPVMPMLRAEFLYGVI